MDTPVFGASVTVGGVNQATRFDGMPDQIITRQSGQLDVPFFDANDQPFDITGLSGTDAKAVPYNTAEVPVTLGTGVISYTGEVFTLTSAGPTAGDFTLTVNGETTAVIAYNANESDVLSALEALASRSPGDFNVLLNGGSNLGDTGAVMEIQLSGSFDLTDRSFGTFSGLTPTTGITFATTQDQSTVQNFYSVTWVKDTIPASYSTFDPEDRDGSIAIFIELEEAVGDYFQVYTRFNVTDGNLAGNQQTLPLTTFLLYYNPVYSYDNTTTDADPGAGKFRMNNTTLSSVTEMYFADDNESSVNMSSQLQSMGIGSTIYFGNPNVQTSAGLFTVSGAPVNNSGYTTVSVTYNDAGTTSLTNGEFISFTLDSTGDTMSFGITYDFDSTTTDADPGAGNFRLNNAAPASATFIYVADDDKGGVNESTYLQSLSTGDYIRFSELVATTAAASYTVNGTPTNATGYTKIPVTYVDSGAGSFTDTNECSFTIDKDSSVADDIKSVFRFEFDTTTTAADPGSGKIRFNNATPASVTAVYISGDNNNAADISSILDGITSGNNIYIEADNDSGDYMVLTASSDITDNTGWFTLAVTVDDSGTLPDNAAILSFDFKGAGGGGGGNFPTSTDSSDKTTAYSVIAGDENTTVVAGSATAADFKITYDVSLWTTAGSLLTVANESSFIVEVEVSNTGTMTIGQGTNVFVSPGGTITMAADTTTHVRVVART